MPTSFLTRQDAPRGLWLLLALLATTPVQFTLAGCVALRPRSERADGGAEPLDAEAQGCEQGSACSCAPVVTTVGLNVIAHGARLTVTGACFADVTAVRIGGRGQTFVIDDDGRLTIDSVEDATPVGLSQPLVVVSPVGPSVARDVIVAHVVVNEVDADTDGGRMQRHQFVEIGTGLDASVDLAEYMVVFFSGADDGVYDTTRGALLGTTATNGLYLLANSMVSGAQATLPTSTLATTADAHAVVLYQGTVLPASTASLGTLTLPMVDALVYSTTATASDAGLLDLCYPEAGDRVQVDEASSGGDPSDQSIRRCGAKRRAGPSFGVAVPTPGAPNGCL